MKKVHKETEQVLLQHEDDVLDELKKAYARSLADIKKRIKEINAAITILENADLENESLLRSKIYQLNFQKSLEKQITASMSLLGQSTVNSVDTFLRMMYEDGYITQFYVMQSLGIPVIAPINLEKMIKAVNLKIEGFKFSQRMYDDVEELGKATKEAIERCIAQGMSYVDTAQHIAALSEATLKQAYTIARTEGGRVSSMAKVEAQENAVKLGADIVKQWDSTWDSHTRTAHQELDGQIKEIHEKFEYHGMKAKAPRMFGVPHMDINCRCVSLTVPRWDIDKTMTKRDGEQDKLVQAENYADWKKKYYEVIKDEN